MTTKPFIEASDRNKIPILAVLQSSFQFCQRILEIGSGTGQHAVYFGQNLAHLLWQPTDLADKIAGMSLWLEEANLPNILPPVPLSVESQPWKLSERFDGIYSSNTLHIMSQNQVESMFRHLPEVLVDGSAALFYGPFNDNGRFVSEGNYQLDQRIKQRFPGSGVKDKQWVIQQGNENGFAFKQEHCMPANNLILEFTYHRE
ncbi:MAG: methylase [Kangiellaceae bacterium]|nr:methylase [Kangiellaceae bacterium]|tara:strand:+ start:12649 stop:13254 length:606 start_codon:yes stop_codon:yes gene_type:complete